MIAVWLGPRRWMAAEECDDGDTTTAFTTFVLFQVVNAVNVRNGWDSVFSRRTLTNPALWIALGSVTALQVAVVQFGPLNDFFGTESLSLANWGVAVGGALSLLGVSELARLIHRLRSDDTRVASTGTADGPTR